MGQDYQDWIRRVLIPLSFRAMTDTPGSFSGAAKKSVIVNDTETGLEFSITGIDNHSARHEEGGADEVIGITGKLNDHSARHEEGGADEVTGITGKLNDHSARHEEGGADEVTGITGKLNDHSARHENGGADEISVAGLSGVLADAQDPQAHGSRHENGGSDPITTLGGNVSFPDRSYFRVSLTSDMSIAANTVTKVAFDAERVDNRGEFDLTNAWFTPEETGYYLLGASAAFAVENVDDDLRLSIQEVGVHYICETIISPANVFTQVVTVTDIAYCVAGEHYAVYVRNVYSNDTIVGSSIATFFHGFRIA